ncbi:peptide ABC transporter substrate-binding protein [Solibacillus sp. FSL W8-0474]|uniref:peptide ABC transporter substrate-binding protein n=1 Tax=Solibacillus sp. FSL W8-0474 TaxID=2975336 RepID=UPI0030F8616C
MVKIVLEKDQQLLTHSPLYRFTTENSEEPNVVTILQQPSAEAYQPFSISEKQGNIYFDLWSYSFAIQLKQVLQAHDTIKGVLRLRRTTNNFSYIKEDILALSEWFGDVRNVTVRSNKGGEMHYTIVLCEFGDSIMAHLEYQSGRDRIEFEWSSHLHIVEFDSLQMSSDKDNNRNLFKNIDAVVQFAIHWNESYEEKLSTIQQFLQRGEK